MLSVVRSPTINLWEAALQSVAANPARRRGEEVSPRKPARAHCEAVADTLDIPRPFNIRAFCSTVAEQRGRPMLLQPLEGPADPKMPCGIWLGTESADLVFYAPEGEGILPTQIILHEIGHMLLGHTAPDLLLADGAGEDEVDSAAERLTWLMSHTDQSVVLPDGSQSERFSTSV